MSHHLNSHLAMARAGPPNKELAQQKIHTVKFTRRRTELQAGYISNKDLAGLISDMEVKFMKSLEIKFADLKKEICEAYESKVDDLRKELSQTYDTRLAKTDNKIQMLKVVLSDIQQRLYSLERAQVGADVLIRGLPVEPNENLLASFKSITHLIGCNNISLIKIFRCKHNNPSPDKMVAPLVIAKLANIIDREKIIIAMRTYTKSKKKLNATDIGFKTNRFISIFECLTQHDRKLFQAAFALKKKGRLASALTKGGKVFIKVEPDDNEMTQINSMEELNFLIPKKKDTEEEY